MNQSKLMQQALAAAAKLPANREECPDHDYIFMQGYLAGVASVQPFSNKDRAFDMREREFEEWKAEQQRNHPRC